MSHLSYRHRCKRRVRFEYRCARRAVLPHEGNSKSEKLVLYAMVSVWAILEIGTTFSGFTPPVSIEWMRYLVLFIIGQQYGLERGRIDHEAPPPGGNPGRRQTHDRLERTDHSGLDYRGNDQDGGNEKSGEK